ncbi:MAG: ribonuclease P protein component [Bacteroidetes bacterium]|nr:ribonuclease P protein component [Bacteroidota bacterium]
MHTFKKSERLCSQKLITELFSKGKSFYINPFKVVWHSTELAVGTPSQLLISVSKRNFKKAVDRNKVKRLIRESFRKNKAPLYEYCKLHEKQCIFMISYNTKIILPYSEIENKIKVILQRLVLEYEKSSK